MIIYIHGFLGSPEDWDPLCSELPGPYERRSTPEGIKKPVTLIGYSLGGRLALNFATRFPHLIEKLIILSSNPGIDDLEERQARLKWDQGWCDIIDNEGLSTFIERWYEQPLFSSFRKTSNFQEILKRRLQNDPNSIKETFQKWSPAILPSCWNAIKSFSFPSLFLFGEHDIRYHSIQKRLVELGLETDLIANSGHAIHLENPQACVEKIKEFICQPVSCKK